jgi:electron transport complex protein RnfG
MKKKIFNLLTFVALALMLQGASVKDDEVMVKEAGGYVVNTTTLGKDVIGYADVIPVKVYIKKNKVEKIEFLKNKETPKYFARVKKALLNKWDGLKTKDAAKLQVDGVTGATLSSDAVIKNVRLGIEYYQTHK